MKNIIISLFDFSGSWSKPYREAGYEVIQIDIKLKTDILEWDYKQIDKSRVYGILAACPCTDFTRLSAQHWKEKDLTGQTAKSISLVKKTLEIIKYLNPDFWVIENPPGRIEKCVPELKNYKLFSFNPFDFGDNYAKLTLLYGCFNPWLIQKPTKPLIRNKSVKSGGGNTSMEKYLNINYPGFSKLSFKGMQELRSITPAGFSRAFFEANNNLKEIEKCKT